MTFVDEETGRAASKQFSPRTIDEFSARRMLNLPEPGRVFDAEFDDTDSEEDYGY